MRAPQRLAQRHKAPMPLLSELFPGPWAVHGVGLQYLASLPRGTLPVSALIAPATGLEALLRCQARRWRVSRHDWRAVASAWSLHYLWTLLPPFVAAVSVRQHALDVSASGLHVCLDHHGCAVTFYLQNAGRPCPGSTTAQRYDPLFQQHLTPLFATLQECAGIASKILWGNVARHLETLFDFALHQVGPSPCLIEDRRILLESTHWPSGLSNPLAAHLRQPGARNASGLLWHRQCCLYYRLPGQTHCEACPLQRPRPQNL